MQLPKQHNHTWFHVLLLPGFLGISFSFPRDDLSHTIHKIFVVSIVYIIVRHDLQSRSYLYFLKAGCTFSSFVLVLYFLVVHGCISLYVVLYFYTDIKISICCQCRVMFSICLVLGLAISEKPLPNKYITFIFLPAPLSCLQHSDDGGFYFFRTS